MLSKTGEFAVVFTRQTILIFAFRRYSAKSLPKYPTCSHKEGTIKCKTLSMMDIKRFHELFYNNKDKVAQDTLIYKCCYALKPKRSCLAINARGKKSVSILYHVVKNKQLVRVCRNAFLGILNLKKDRVQRIVKKCENVPKENRGGDRVGLKNEEKKRAISHYIESLKCTESHYCRSRTNARIYISCTLNIRKLYKLYSSSAEDHLKIKESYFRKFVNRNYNLGFGTPKTDVCSVCLNFKEEIKKEKDETLKTNLITTQRVHKLKANAFFAMLKEEKDNVINYSFDCQKNLALPRLPDSSAYFSHQYNLYNFTIVKGSSKSQLRSYNVTSYLWTDVDLPKNSSIIASALFDFLRREDFPASKDTIRLFADGCGGQNKNSIVLTMLLFWLVKYAPVHVKTIEFVFPIVGHSFMPPDRVFGLIEREIKKNTCICEPREYYSIIEQHSTLRVLGKDWHAYDWKAATQDIIKLPGKWHFQFNPSKRFLLTRGNQDLALIQGEAHYRTNVGMARSVCKKGKRILSIAPNKLVPGRTVNEDKKKSIDNLLIKHFGPDWTSLQNLKFYKDAMENQNVQDSPSSSTMTEEFICDQNPEDDTRFV